MAVMLRLLCLVSMAYSLKMPSHKLVLVVLDGFSPSYLNGTQYNTTHLDSLGVVVRNVTPEFPASKLPFLAALANGRHSLDNRVLGTQWSGQDMTQEDERRKKVTVSADQEEFWEQVRGQPLIWVNLLKLNV